jgi:hypothetical protein
MRRILIAAGSALFVMQGCSLRLQGAPTEREYRRNLEAHAVDVTVNASRDVISISTFTRSEAKFSLVNDGPGCDHR